MNKIDKNYLPKLNLRETQEASHLIDKLLIEKLNDSINFVVVRQPIISSSKQNGFFTNSNETRQINFDSVNSNNIYYIFNDYNFWLYDALNKINIKNNNAILMIANYIDRDSKIKNTQSMEKRKLYMEYRFDAIDQNQSINKALELNEIIYNSIKFIQLEIYKKFPELRNDFKLPIELKKVNLRKILTHNSSLKSILNDIATN